MARRPWPGANRFCLEIRTSHAAAEIFWDYVTYLIQDQRVRTHNRDIDADQQQLSPPFCKRSAGGDWGILAAILPPTGIPLSGGRVPRAHQRLRPSRSSGPTLRTSRG